MVTWRLEDARETPARTRVAHAPTTGQGGRSGPTGVTRALHPDSYILSSPPPASHARPPISLFDPDRVGPARTRHALARRPGRVRRAARLATRAGLPAPA